MNSPDVSIIVVSWNTREMTLACLDSVFAGVADLRAEVFVVDNASTDGSADAVAERWPQVHLIRNQENIGFARANNQALRRACGRYALLLNSDTRVLGDVLSSAVAYLDRFGDVGVMGCRVLNPDGSLQLTCFQLPSCVNLLLLTSGLDRLPWPRCLGRHQMRHWRRNDERDVDVVTGCFMLVRSRTIQQVGMLDECFFFCGEETDWCHRISQAGWKVRFAPVGEIIHYGNSSGRQLRARRDVLLSEGIVRFHRKHGGRGAAACAWSILLLFNTSRSVFWYMCAVLGRRTGAATRASHFGCVVAAFPALWRRVVVAE